MKFLFCDLRRKVLYNHNGRVLTITTYNHNGGVQNLRRPFLRACEFSKFFCNYFPTSSVSWGRDRFGLYAELNNSNSTSHIITLLITQYRIEAYIYKLRQYKQPRQYVAQRQK